MDLTISIIGFGNIGKSIASLLLVKKEYNIHINVVDIDWNVSGAILDLKHAIQLDSKHSISHNSNDLLNSSDYIFHCAGASVPKGKSRMTVVESSAEITETVFKRFQTKKEPFIIVVANPVEIISYITQRVTNLPKQNILGTGTLVDSIRMNYILKETNLNLDKINAVVLGEHGTTAFLSRQLSKVNGKSIDELLDEDSIDELMNVVKASAEEIKETQKATIYGVSYCAVYLFDKLNKAMPSFAPISTYVDDNLDFLKGPLPYLSLYSEISKKGVFPVKSYSPNEEEENKLKHALEHIKLGIPKKFF